MGRWTALPSGRFLPKDTGRRGETRGRGGDPEGSEQSLLTQGPWGASLGSWSSGFPELGASQRVA